MIYLALGAGALAFWLWITGGKPVFKRREWRFGAAMAALVAFAGAAYAGVRGAWEPLVALAVLGLWLASSARTRGAPRPPPAASSRMGRAEAARILGVAPDASREEIQAAYSRLMRAVHPDKGGTAGLAAQLNAARDVLLGK
ncbi:MAG: DnaJ domain-containing protein [Caulobacterales bacterium]|nr:DnaJ domain-containing protein [Caulobacterales bacterium]